MDDVVAASKAIIERGSKSFAAASKLFDATTRENAFMLYAWCRYCDDQIDGQELGFGQRSPEPAEQRQILDSLRRRTDAAMAGEPQDDPVFIAFQRVFRRCAIPTQYPLDLLDGFAMDVDQHDYHTLEDTLLYAYHVAGVVGAMMATIMGVRARAVIDRAIDLGIALQLTNIARDVMEDAQDGRVYLPATWLAEAGAPTDPAEFVGREPQIYPVVARLLDEADRYYASSAYGLAQLPFRSAWAVAAARSVYRAIGQTVRARGARAWEVRARVGTPRKLALLGVSGVIAAKAVLVDKRQPAPGREGLWTAP